MTRPGAEPHDHATHPDRDHDHDHDHGEHDHAAHDHSAPQHAAHDNAAPGHKHGGFGGGHHHHVDPNSGDGRLGLAIAVNMLLTLAQIVGGIFAGSLALIADALHNFSDALSLVIAYVARRIARRDSDASMTFGYGRIELVAALVNYTTLTVIGLWLGGEAFWRFFEPQEVDGWIVVIVSGVALVIDVATALLVLAMSKTSANMRAAFLHNVADAAGSAAVIVAGVLVLLFDWRLVDPFVTLLISGYIVWLSVSEVGGVIRVLMLGAPPGIATGDVVAAVNAVEGVTGVHRTRFWQVGEHETAFDAHIVIAFGAWSEADHIKATIKRVLAERFDISSSTLELECAVHACHAAPAYGHG